MTNEDKTTSVFAKAEFWITLVTSVSGLLLAFGVITQEQSDSVAKFVPNIIGAVMSLLSSMKFIGVQHAAKVEVFRAMCAMRIENKGAVTAQGVGSSDAEVLKAARVAGL